MSSDSYVNNILEEGVELLDTVLGKDFDWTLTDEEISDLEDMIIAKTGESNLDSYCQENPEMTRSAAVLKLAKTNGVDYAGLDLSGENDPASIPHDLSDHFEAIINPENCFGDGLNLLGIIANLLIGLGFTGLSRDKYLYYVSMILIFFFESIEVSDRDMLYMVLRNNGSPACLAHARHLCQDAGTAIQLYTDLGYGPNMILADGSPLDDKGKDPSDDVLIQILSAKNASANGSNQARVITTDNFADMIRPEHDVRATFHDKEEVILTFLPEDMEGLEFAMEPISIHQKMKEAVDTFMEMERV